MSVSASVPLAVTELATGVRFSVRVVPRATRSAIEGTYGDALKVRLNAPPVDGAANDALIALLAEVLAVPRRAVALVSGERSRTKVIAVTGVRASDILRLVNARP